MTGQLIGSIIGLLIAIGVITGTFSQIKKGTVKKGIATVLLIVGFVALSGAVYSIINIFKN